MENIAIKTPRSFGDFASISADSLKTGSIFQRELTGQNLSLSLKELTNKRKPVRFLFYAVFLYDVINNK